MNLRKEIRFLTTAAFCYGIYFGASIVTIMVSTNVISFFTVVGFLIVLTMYFLIFIEQGLENISKHIKKLERFKDIENEK